MLNIYIYTLWVIISTISLSNNQYIYKYIFIYTIQYNYDIHDTVCSIIYKDTPLLYIYISLDLNYGEIALKIWDSLRLVHNCTPRWRYSCGLTIWVVHGAKCMAWTQRNWQLSIQLLVFRVAMLENVTNDLNSSQSTNLYLKDHPT